MFAGLFTYPDAPPPESWVDIENWWQALAPFTAPDIAGHWSHGNALLVESRRFNTPSSHHVQQVPYREDELTVAFWGRLDNRTDLARALEIYDARLDALPDAALVAKSWHRWGEAMPEHLLGDFGLAIVDSQTHTLFLVRDPLGVKPLYYWPHANGVIFASTVSAMRCLKEMEPTPDSQWMARYLLHISMSHEQTGYREILKLPAGHCLRVDGDGHMQLRRWHAWRDDAPEASHRDSRWLEAYREVLEEAIRCRMASHYPLGTENSGGIDSASVTAYMARLMGDEPGDRLHSFGFARCEQEPEFIMQTSIERGITHNYLITVHRILDGVAEERVKRYLQVCGYPSEHGNASTHIPFYLECERHGIRTLFSGFGGDEVVTNPGGHLRCELLDQNRYDALWDVLPGNPIARLLRLGKAVVTGYPRPDYNPNFLQAWNARWPYQPLLHETIERLGLHEEYMETARFDAPYRRVNDWIINGLLPKPYIPTRLENCTLMAASYGIDYCWPLWDVRLVQQYLSTPAIEKVGPKGIGRYLHRRAITGTVPDKVAWKSSKDMGYARLHQAMDESGIVDIATAARREEERMHPAVAELMDRPKWKQQIDRAAQGNVQAEFGFVFRRTAHAVRWLNHWLHGDPTA